MIEYQMTPEDMEHAEQLWLHCTCGIGYECIAHEPGPCPEDGEDCCISRTDDSPPFPIGITTHYPHCPFNRT